MMRSLSSGVSGLQAHQMAMDIIGNNIANVNTVGFKSSRATFQEVFSETLKGAGSPQDGKGGSNPEQVGLGISVAGVDTLMTRGGVNRTDNPTDLCISGNGFFMVSDDSLALNKYYTRAGNFTVDKQGSLVTPSGMKVLGYMYDATGKPKPTLEALSIPVSSVVPPMATKDTITVKDTDGNVVKDASSNALMAGVEFQGNLNASGADRNTTIKVYDSLGNTHDVSVKFQRSSVAAGAQTWTVSFSDPSSGTAIGTASTLSFDGNGKLTTNPPIVSLSITGGGVQPATDPLTFNVSFAKLTSVAAEGDASAPSISGYPQGTLDNFSITPAGEITGVFSNGQNKVLGRIALANFSNPAGLEKQGENLYNTSNNSGEAIIGTPGDNGMGQLNAGSLEMSNVDLAREFTNMITIERGFQANSKIITTSDEMLQELVNLKR